MTLDPVPSTVTPKLSAHTAYAICHTPHAPACQPGRLPLIQLAYVTDTQSGTLEPNGSMTLTMNHTLAYLMTWTAAACPPAHGGPGSSVVPQPTNSCVAREVVDAKTGKALLSEIGSAP